MNKFIIHLFLTLLFISTPLWAIREKDGEPWNVTFKTRNEYERALQQEFPDGGFFINLGPTGIRAQITPENPDQFVVKYVFQDKLSPAKGKIIAGDIIVGANDKLFKTAHIFGRGGDRKGWYGPIMELSEHIENSQSKDGVLKLIVWPGGDKLKKKHVEIKLKAVGAFSETYPWNCPRSEKRAKELCDVIADGFKKKPHMHRRGPHANTHAILALMANGHKEHESVIKNYVKDLEDFNVRPQGSLFINWGIGFNGVLLGEYSLLYKTDKLKKAMVSIARSHLQTSWNGGEYTHNSILGIRLGNGNPYASIAGISGLAMLSATLFKKGGYMYSEYFYDQVHLKYLNSAGTPGTDNGNINYCFVNKADRTKRGKGERNQYALIKMKDPKSGVSGKGPGFVVPQGMKDIKDYEIIWPKADNPDVPKPAWVESEKEQNLVIECVDGLRYVYQNNPKFQRKNNPEPKKAFKTKKGGMHSFPVGLGALVHLLDNEKRPSWIHLGQHLADTCALSYENSFDGHGGGQLHGFWTVLGAGMAREKLKRKYLDYLKCFLIMSETHYGAMIIQPWGRDRGVTTDVWYGAEVLPAATAAILLSLPKQRLQITGASLNSPASNLHGKTSLPKKVAKATRKALILSENQLEQLDKVLLNTLVKLSASNELEKIPLTLSISSQKIWLTKVSNEVGLIFQRTNDSSKVASFSFSKLSRTDRAILSRLIAALKPDNKNIQAFAGIFMEQLGNNRMAQKYFKMSDEQAIKKIEKFLNSQVSP